MWPFNWLDKLFERARQRAEEKREQTAMAWRVSLPRRELRCDECGSRMGLAILGLFDGCCCPYCQKVWCVECQPAHPGMAMPNMTKIPTDMECPTCLERLGMLLRDGPTIENEKSVTVRTNIADLQAVYAHLPRGDAARGKDSKLWLLCQDQAMALALVVDRPASTNALLLEQPDIVRFPNGNTAACFTMIDGRRLVPLANALATHHYESAKPLVLGGIAAGIPTADIDRLQQFWSCGEAENDQTNVIWTNGWCRLPWNWQA